MNTIMTFDHRPSPNHSRRSGRNTSRGVALKAVMKGSNIALSAADRPSRTPRGRPTAIAIDSPIAKAEALTPSGPQIAPVANILQSVPPISLGTVKNSLVPSCIVMRHGRSSQTSSRTTMLPKPRMAGSKRCHMPFLGAARSSTGATAATFASMAWISLMVLLPGSPWERRTFGPPNAFRQHHGDDHDDDNAAKHSVERENIAEPGNGVTDSFRGREELANQHADQRAPHGNACAGNDVRQYAWKDDLEIKIPLAAAQRPNYIDEQAIDGANPGIGIEDEGKDREEKDNECLAADADAEKDHDQGRKRHERARIEHSHQRIERITDAHAPAHDDAKRDADDYSR